MRKLKPIVPCLACLGVLLVTTPLRFASLYLDLWISFVLHFAVSLLLYYRLAVKPGTTLIVYLTTALFLQLPDILLSIFEGQSVSIGDMFLQNILPAFIAPICAYSFYRTSGIRRVTSVALALGFYLTNIFWFDEAWSNCIKLGTLNRETHESLPQGWEAKSLTGDPYTADSLKGKLTLLDFWGAGCPACIRAFPAIDSLHASIKDKPQLSIQSIYIPYYAAVKPDFVADIVKQKNVHFPVAVAQAGLDSVFRIHSYPTVLLVYDNSIIYRGGLGDAFQKMMSLAPSLVKTEM
jgi:thiol-disulfide isomerase/thioredoxin